MSRFIRVLAIFPAALLILMTACSEKQGAVDGRDFTGKWKGAAEKTGSPNPTIRLEILKEGETISGTLTTLDGSFRGAPLADGKIVNGELSFRAVANGDTQFKDHLYLFAFHRKGEEIVGTWTDLLNGTEGPVKLSPDRE